jgi:virulence factor Mce-like protein
MTLDPHDGRVDRTRRLADPRDHLTEGVTATRLQRETRKSLKPVTLTVLSVVAAAVIASYLMSSTSAIFGHDTYTVRWAVPQNYGVYEGFDEVRFRGVTAGTITEVEREGPRLILVTKIRKDIGKVYKDARAQIRPVTPLNDVYLDVVDPGTPAAGRAEENEPLGERQTATSVTVADVLNVFDEDVRKSTYRLLDQLGNGMADRGAGLRRAFVALGPFLDDAGALTRQIARRERATKRLVHNVAVLTTELGRRDGELKRLTTTGAATVAALRQGAGDLDRTLAELAPTFTTLRSSLAEVRGVVDDVDGGLRALVPVADRVPAALKTVDELVGVLRPAATRLRPAVRGLTPFVSELDEVSRHLGPIAGALRPHVPVLDRLTRNLVSCEDGVIGFFQWNTSLGKFGDRTGPILRGNLAAGVPAAGAPGEATREPEPGCTPGPTVKGVVERKDEH